MKQWISPVSLIFNWPSTGTHPPEVRALSRTRLVTLVHSYIQAATNLINCVEYVRAACNKDGYFITQIFVLCHLPKFTFTFKTSWKNESNVKWVALRELVSLVQFKKRGKKPWLYPATLLKVTLFRGCFYTFFKLHKWYQIAQRITNITVTWLSKVHSGNLLHVYYDQTPNR